VLDMLAEECGLDPAQLTDGAVRVVERPPVPGTRSLARPYPRREPSLFACSFGNGATVVVSPSLLAEAQRLLKDADRDAVFAPRTLGRVSTWLAPSGVDVYGPYPRLLAGRDTLVPRPPPPGCRLWVEASPSPQRVTELEPVRWPHAISPRRVEPDRVVALAERDGLLVGVAAASDDSPHLWQIGIDVAPEARGIGIGASLTSALAAYVLAQGAAPWYGAAPANIPSIRTALSCGFRLAWVEAFTMTAGH
jgi:RimJ/RimL family protein N-acetyltransferase